MGEGPELSLREGLASGPDLPPPQGRRPPLGGDPGLWRWAPGGAIAAAGMPAPKGGGSIRSCPKPWALPGRSPLALLPGIMFSGGGLGRPLRRP